MTEELLKIERRGAIEHLILNRPDSLNSLNQPLADALFAYFRGKQRDAETRVILVSGAGRGFCSGADLRGWRDQTPDRLRDGPDGDWLLRDMLKAMRACPQPIVALVHGAAAGGGLVIALAADIIVVGSSAAFHSAFIKIGLSGTELGAGWRLQRAIGISRAREMLLTGRPMNATDAVRCGLASAEVADEDMIAYGYALAEDMLKAAPDALRVTKRSLDATLEISSYDTAMEVEERGQIQMVRAAPTKR
ncbi:MAG: enoyl-CoA hydratase/isomerase family protein [Hyphomicrobiales bacterium]|nr:enoyl-CoA hydratase/isomerase family protein [Hyphomicrobiales bacterium]